MIDNEIDSKNPYVSSEIDRRKIKINKDPLEKKPSRKLRN